MPQPLRSRAPDRARCPICGSPALSGEGCEAMRDGLPCWLLRCGECGTWRSLDLEHRSDRRLRRRLRRALRRDRRRMARAAGPVRASAWP